MPRGGRLQFRYETAIVAPHLHDALRNNRLTGTNALIAHVDCRVAASEATVIPCRWATLTRSRQAGSFEVMHLEVGAFAHAPDLQAARRELPDDLPRFDSGAKRWAGYWCHLLRDAPSAIARSEAIDTWQLIIGQLAQVESFQREPFFYHVEGMFEPNSDVAAGISGGHYSIRPTADYDVRIVHYIPHHDEHAADRTPMTHA